MRVTTTIAETRGALDDARDAGRTVGLVPTMGALHEGHRSPIDAAANECDFTVVTIFVNPLQFAPTEDLASYPRDLDRDLAFCREAEVDLVFAPSVEEMYPGRVVTSVEVLELSAPFEGIFRPDHFAGVTTVVAKLFNIVGRCRAYFGEKDFQQLVLLRRMTADLSFPVEIVRCPTIRASDGVALSSRHRYLTQEERAAAAVLYRALETGRALIDAGERDPDVVDARMRKLIEAEPLAQLEYCTVVDAATLRVVRPLAGEVRLLAAARFGRPRLIDNVGTTVGTTAAPAAFTKAST